MTSLDQYIVIWYNDVLSNLVIENLSNIPQYLSIRGNNSLMNFDGFSGLTSIGGYLLIEGNGSLSNITGLGNLQSIDGNLEIMGNSSLISLAGLNNIQENSIEDLSIYYNLSLSECDVQSICDFLASPNGTIDIYSNAPGCNSEEEIEVACLSSCLPEGITFTTQEQIDNFQINYPGCTEIEGNVMIYGLEIDNINL